MKKFIVLAIFISFTLGFAACKKNTSTTCNLDKTDTVPAAMDILFKATKKGDGSISTLNYKVGSLEKTISNPSLPWSAEVPALSGDAISITATGTTSNGSLTISYDGKSGGYEIQGSDDCSHSNK